MYVCMYIRMFMACILYTYPIGSVSLENPDEYNISDIKTGI